MLTQADMEASAYVEAKLKTALAEQNRRITELQQVIAAYRWIAPGLLIDSRTAERIIVEAQIDAAWGEHERQLAFERIA